MEVITDNTVFAILYVLVYTPIFYVGGCILFADAFPEDG